MSYYVEQIDIHITFPNTALPDLEHELQAEFSRPLEQILDDLVLEFLPAYIWSVDENRVYHAEKSKTETEICTGTFWDGIWHHGDMMRFLSCVAKYAKDGSYMRCQGEDGSLFGYEMVGGKLYETSATVQWHRDP